MKRKILVFLFFLLLSFAFAGCDSIDIDDLTLPISTDQTTQDPTMTDQTTQESTTTEKTTSEGTTTDFDANTTTDNTSTQTTEAAIELSVTFLDWDDTLIEVVSVVKGEDANPPVNPSRLGAGNYVYTFSGWSGTYLNVQTDLTLHATYTLNYVSDTDYSHSNLLFLAASIFETTDEDFLEDSISHMMNLTESISEHEMYDMLTEIATLKEDLEDTRDAADFQNLMTKTLELGFDGQMLAQIALNLLTDFLAEEYDNLADKIDVDEGKVVLFIDQVSDLQAQLQAVDSAVADYCLLSTDSTLCNQWFTSQKLITEASDQYYTYLNSNQVPDNFDRELYHTLENLFDSYLYARESSTGADEIASAYDKYMDKYNALDENLDVTDELLAKYEAKEMAVYNFENIDFVDIDSDLKSLGEYYWGYWDDDLNSQQYGYQQIYFQLRNANDNLLNYQARVLNLQVEFDSLGQVVLMLEDPEFKENVHDLIIMIYDGLFASTSQVDQEMIDFLYDLMASTDDGMGSLSLLLGTTPEDLTYALNKLGRILGEFEGTLTQEEYTLIADMIKVIIPLMIVKPDMTQLEIHALNLIVEDLVDYYLPILFSTGSDLTLFLETFTIEKADAIFNLLITLQMDINANEDQMFIEIAETIDSLLGDDVLDIELLAETFVDLYFLINDGPGHDVDTDTIKLAMTSNISQIMLLAQDMNDMNQAALTESDFNNIDEFKIRINTMLKWIENEFTDMSHNESFTYSQQVLIDLLNEMDWQADQDGIDQLTLILGTSTEEETYYLLRSINNYMFSISMVRNFEDLQEWLAALDAFGLTQGQAIDLIFMLAQDAIDFDISSWIETQDLYQEKIDEFALFLIQEVADLEDYEQDILIYIATLPTDLQVDILALWQAEKLLLEEEQVYNNSFNELQTRVNMSDLINITESLDRLYYLSPGDSDYTMYQNQYNMMYDSFTGEIKALLDQFLILHNNLKAAEEARNDLVDLIINIEDIIDAIDDISFYLPDYEESSNLIFLYLLTITEKNEMITEIQTSLLGVEQDANDYILTLAPNIQDDIRDLWEAYMLECTTFHIYSSYYNELFDYFDEATDPGGYMESLEHLRELELSDPEYLTYMTQKEDIYNSHEPENQAMLDQLELLFNDHCQAKDIADALESDLRDQGILDGVNLSYFWNDYSLLRSNLHVQYRALNHYQALVDIENQDILGVNQLVADYIISLSPELQSDMTAYWAVMTLKVDTHSEYTAYYSNLYNFIDGDDLYNLQETLNQMYILDPSNPEEERDYMTNEILYLSIYNSYSYEEQMMIDEFKRLYYDYLDADSEFRLLSDNLKDSQTLNAIIDEITNNIIEYSSIQQEILQIQSEIDYYTLLFEHNVYDNDLLLILYDLMNDHPVLIKSLMAIIIEDTQNVFGSMPSDSFDEIMDLIRFIALEHGSFTDFDSQDILALSQDLSAMIKLFASSIDSEDELIIDQFLELIFEYIADEEGLTGSEKDNFVLGLMVLADEYIVHADDVRDQLTILLDSLTLEKIDAIIDFAHSAYNEESMSLEMIVGGANLLSSIMDVEDLDIKIVVEVFLKSYLIENGFYDYDSLELGTLQTAYAKFIDESLLLIDGIGAIDLNDVTTEDMAMIMELKDRFEFLGSMSDVEDMLLDYTYNYELEDFEELIVQIFGVSESEMAGVILNLKTLTGLNEEETYYQVLSIVLVLSEFQSADSITDMMHIYKGLRGIGLTNSQISKYGLSIFRGMIYPTMLEELDNTNLLEEINILEDQVSDVETIIDDLQTDLLLELDTLGPQDKALAIAAWQQAVIYIEYSYTVTLSIKSFEASGYYFDHEMFFYYLSPAYDDGDRHQIQALYDAHRFSQEEIDFYVRLYSLIQTGQPLQDNFEAAVDLVDSPYDEMIRQAYGSYLNENGNHAGFNVEIELLKRLLQENEEKLLIFNSINQFFSENNNLIMTEQVLEILLEEIEMMSMNPNIGSIDIFMRLALNNFEGLREIDKSQIALELNKLSLLMGLMGSTIDASDSLIIKNFMNEIISVYIENLDIENPAKQAELIADYQAIINNNLDDILTMPDTLSVFLASMTEEKVSDILRLLRQFNWIDDQDEIASYKEVIIQAQLIAMIMGDASLDYESMVESLMGLYFDISKAQGDQVAPDKTLFIFAMVDAFDLLLLQAEIVADIGIFGISEDNVNTITTFIDSFENILNFGAETVIID